MMRVPKIFIVMALTAGLAACGKGGELNTDAAIALRVQTAGGFVPPGVDQASVPEFALTSDGRVVTGGPQIEIYPGPAMPNMQQRSITAAGIDAIAAEARAAGLFGPDKHYDSVGIADAGTTFFTVVADGERHQISANALGMDAGGVQGGPGAPDAPGGAPQDEDARAKLQRFREKLGDLSTWLPAGSLGDEQLFEITALRVVANETTANPDENPRPGEMDWPLGSLATSAGGGNDARCFVIAGDDLAKVLPRARKATQNTVWHSDGKSYNVQFRPQLPDEQGCEVPTARR